MATILERCQALWSRLQSGPATYPTALSIDADRVADGAPAPTLTRDASYLAVRLNQLRLASGRSWWVKVQPMAFVVVELSYDGEPLAVPMVVGPSMIERYGQPVPQGMLFEDTVVAGLHPYKGGRIAITTVLYEVPATNEAKRLLGLVERAAGLFPAGTQLGTYLKVANVVLDGLEDVLGLDDVKPVTGRRHELAPDLGDSLGTGLYVLTDAEVKPRDLWVKDRRLQLRDAESGGFYDLPASDYLLYSLVSVPERNDIDQLAFHPTLREAEKLAHSDASVDGWNRAKAMMTTGFVQVIDSPDLTPPQGDALRATYRDRLKALHEEALADAKMGGEEQADTRRAAALSDAASLLELD